MIKRSFYKENIKIPNTDISSPEKDIKTNTTIIQFLSNLGEKSAANYLEKRIVQSSETKYSDSLNKEYRVNEKNKQKELIKISGINSGILERLSAIEKNMIDEQDTRLKQISKKEATKPALQIIREEHDTSSKGLSWFDMLLGALLGVGMLAFLKGFKNLGPVKFAISMMEMGWHWLKDKVVDLATTIAKSIMKPLEEVLEFIISRLAKIPGLEDIALKGKNKPPKIDAKVNTPDAKVNTPDAKVTKTPDINADKLAKETEKATAKVSEKAVGKGLLKKIPFLGLGLAGAFAADRIGEGDYAGAGMEIASGILSIVPGLGTAGSVGVDAALLVRDINRMNEAVITKLDNEGVIDKGWFGDTTVEDWNAVRKLSTQELKALAEYQDLNKSDKEKVMSILYKKQIEQIKIPDEPESFNNGVKVVFNDREILADNLLQSDNKLQEFLINNPFTDENSIEEEIEVNGEKITQIKFKDEELNKQYAELKEQYDRDYKKYKDARDSQLQNLKDIQEIEGEYLTPDQIKNYQTSGMNMVDYASSTTKGAAKSDVLNALREQYKNTTIPSDLFSLAERIKGAEGFRATAYDDAGHKSIGYGHQIKAGEEYLFGATLTKEEADALFAKDLENYSRAASKIPGFQEAPKRAQEALIDMTYNMGPAWYKEWPGLVKNLQAKNYKGVSAEILDSNYATQVKGRALINAKIFENASGEVKTASSDVNIPKAPENNSNLNINKLNKDNATETKQAQVQKVEDTNRSLVSSVSSSGNTGSGTTVINSVQAPNAENSYALMDLFNRYD